MTLNESFEKMRFISRLLKMDRSHSDTVTVKLVRPAPVPWRVKLFYTFWCNTSFPRDFAEWEITGSSMEMPKSSWSWCNYFSMSVVLSVWISHDQSFDVHTAGQPWILWGFGSLHGKRDDFVENARVHMNRERRWNTRIITSLVHFMPFWIWKVEALLCLDKQDTSRKPAAYNPTKIKIFSYT